MSGLDAPVRLYGSSLANDRQQSALRSGDVPVGVYGLGKMGLPLAAVYAKTTGNVLGADIDPEVVETVNAGHAHVEGEPGLEDLVRETVTEGELHAYTDGAKVAEEAAVHVVIVPTLVDEEDDPDLDLVRAVASDIAAGLAPGDMILFESTLPPRSCQDVLLPLVEAESGLDRSQFGLAFCPERTSSGRAINDIRGAYPKIVGGIDEESTRVATLIYEEITHNEVIQMESATAAEAVKVFEGVYRDVNIALANELGMMADELGIDVVDAIEAANTQPYCDIHSPGAGVGGHCIPYYPYFLIGELSSSTRLLSTARSVNEMMPLYTMEFVLGELRSVGKPPSDASVLVLGLTYRPGIAETRATPALPIVDHLDDAGVDVHAVDPVLDEYGEFEAAGATIEQLGDVEDQTYDGVVMVTSQPAFESLDVRSLRTPGERLVVVDGRQALTHLRDDIEVEYCGVGLHD
ncbi:nucleotide sugar dehydrogenase [Haloarchaeobius sp. FL176]|uniref:nucleotide sugar dehydrogenase n=1 Tax=Haloarchaeobius sp. FL176 TaxID=2967129 RepID=UPI0021498640|nr:nucleotide sugar dehydrogenase [Haloarchaeobius sp. FL176]